MAPAQEVFAWFNLEPGFISNLKRVPKIVPRLSRRGLFLNSSKSAVAIVQVRAGGYPSNEAFLHLCWDELG
jgi:hypothetical protein